MSLRITSFVTLLATGCLGLSCGDADTTGPGTGPVQDFTVSADAITPTTLGTEVSFSIHLVSTGYAGPVSLHVNGAPVEWQLSLADSSLTLTAQGDASTTVAVTIPTNGPAATTGDTLTVLATSTNGTHSATTVLTVANEYIIPIVAGTGTDAHWGTLAGAAVHLNVGTQLTIRNDDVTEHIIHTNNSIPGFPHQNVADPMATGESYSNILIGDGTDAFYCHVHGLTTGSVIVIVP